MLGVFISSSFRDLIAERTAVRCAIEQLASGTVSLQVRGMEDFGAIAASPLRVSEEFAEAADIVILLVAGSYGSLAPDRRISFTQAEYEACHRSKIPVLAYLEDAENASIPAEVIAFRARLSQELTIRRYSGIAELAARVSKDVSDLLINLRTGEDIGTRDLSTPPAADTTGFVGRLGELSEIRSGLKDFAPRVGLWGSTGVGKTTLIQQFFTTREAPWWEPIWLRMDDLFGRDTEGG